MNLSEAISYLNFYKAYNIHSKVISNVNNEIAKFVDFYAYDKLNKICNKLSENDRVKFKIMINSISFNTIMPNISKISFITFIENIFEGVDKEERAGNKSEQLCAAFRLIADLIEIIYFWENIPDEWIIKSIIVLYRKIL